MYELPRIATKYVTYRSEFPPAQNGNSGSVQEHNIARRELIKVKGIEDVIIVSKPSQIP